MFDRVVRAGTVVDGTGEPSFTGDIAIRDGLVVEVSDRPLRAAARETVDADGALVTPGFAPFEDTNSGLGLRAGSVSPAPLATSEVIETHNPRSIAVRIWSFMDITPLVGSGSNESGHSPRQVRSPKF